ncbi:MAG: cytochrome D1 domain-containing protein [Acidobacteriota bacterium]
MKRMPLLIALIFAVCCASAKAQMLLVVNQGNATVSVIDPATGNQVGVIDEGTSGVHAHEVVASPGGKMAFLPVYGSTGVGKPGIDGTEMLILDLGARKVVGHVDFGHAVRPHLPVLDPVSGMLYVTTELDKAVTVISPATGKIVGKIPTGQDQSHMLAISHDGKRGYTANVDPGTVSVLDMQARKLVTVIPVAGDVQRIAISADDKWVFTSDVTLPRLAVIETATNKVVKWVELPGSGYGGAVTKDGKWMLLAIPSTNQVAVIDLQALKVVKTIDVPAKPQEILIRPNGETAYVSCNVSGKVAAIDMKTLTVQKLISAGPGADGLGWAK